MHTEIATLGEFGLIRHLTDNLPVFNNSTKKGVGDDAAVIDNQGEMTLVTTDLMLEGVHFDLIYFPLKHLGYKAAMINFSDIYAMNGFPKQITVSLGISKRFSVEDMEELYSGIRLACEEQKVDIIGGDTTSSANGLAISITCIGSAKPDEIVSRSGAQEGDLICVSGDLGAAYAGLQILEREKIVFQSQAKEAAQKSNTVLIEEEIQPDFAGKEYLLERQLKPSARRDIIEILRKANLLPTSMIDISDGLSGDMLHICEESGVGCRIYEEHVPIDYQTAVQAEQFNMNLTTFALNGGEDYELLFTLPISAHSQIAEIDGIKAIGHITKKELGSFLVTRDGQEFPLEAQGHKNGSETTNI